MKRIVNIFLAAALIVSGAAFGPSFSVFAAEAEAQEASLYHVMPAGRYDLFSNYEDGYELFVDPGMEVDMRYAGIAAVLENETKRIEIYCQSLSGLSRAGYINYSNRFLQNQEDHYGIVQQTEEIRGRSVHVTAWERKKLARVENDKNYYVCLDIPDGNNIYTILVKSSLPIGENGGYRYLAENFSTMRAKKSGYVRISETVSESAERWNEETRGFYQKYFNEPESLSWGIFEPNIDYQGTYEKLEQYEAYLDYAFPVLLSYTEVKNTSVDAVRSRLSAAYERGKVLELTLQTSQAENNMVYEILDGKYDSYLRAYAEVIREFGHPVLFRLFNEMNGDWCPYSAYNTSRDTQIFCEAYRYIYSIFEESGANENTLWVWNPNSVSYPNFDWNHALMYYPGDEYVDIIGMTAYNTGTYYSGEKWQSFGELYDAMYRSYCEWFTQPFMITEFASSSVGGDKAAWMTDMFSKIKSYGKVRLAVWWDGCDRDADGNIARPYFLDETPETLEVFRKGIIKPWNTDVYA